MKKHLMLLLYPILLGAQIPHFSYSHPQLKLIDFDSPKVVSTVDVITVNALEGDGIPDKWTETYRFDGDSTKVKLSGKGVPWIFQFDEERRIKSIKDGNGIIKFHYAPLQDTVISLPSDTVVTRHSRKYITKRNSDGDTVMITVIPTDWKQNVPNSEFWDPSHSDTAWITHDSQGRISSVKRQFWTTNHFHSVPWKKVSDSLVYSYTNAPDSSLTIVNYFQHPVNEKWLITKESKALVTKYNDDGNITLFKELRWDAGSADWDSVYVRETRMEYSEKLLKSSKEWLFWGTDEEPDSACIRDEIWTYQANPFSGSTPVSDTKSMTEQTVSTSYNSDGLYLTLPTGGSWSIAITDLRGRVVHQMNHTSSGMETFPVPLNGVASGVYLMKICEKSTRQIFLRKIVR